MKKQFLFSSKCLAALFIVAILFCLPINGLALNNFTFRKNTTASSPHFFVIDTSITALDPILSCGSGSQVRLIAGVAQTYQWVRNGVAIPGATNRQLTASISGAYRVRVGDGLGNLDSSRIIDVLIVPYPSTNFTVNQVTQCLVGNNFQFINSTIISQGTATYAWYYGDGSYQLSTNGSHSYSTAGTYSVKLVATSNYGCVDSVRTTVSVNLPPVAAFTVNNAAQCINGNQFFFTNGSTSQNSPMTYRWEFGDGSTSTQINPAYQFTQHGINSVKLVASSQSGCKDSVMQNVTLHPKPIVSFTVNNNQQCQTANYFQYTNNSSIATGTMTHYWTFGDGVTSGLFSPSHSYLNPGIYPVQLLETSDKGCRDSLTINAKVDPSPTALFTVNKTTDCFAEHQFMFTNATTLSGGTFTSLWDFGDGVGSSTVVNPSYRYLQPGTYRVTLTVRTTANCTSSYSMNLFLNATPTGSILPVTDTVICEGSFIELRATPSTFYQWYRDGNMISGATSISYNATEPGIYHVVFRNASNCSSVSTNRVTLTKVYQPTPDFSFDRSCADLATTFTNASVVSSSLPVTYNWNFGDGGTSTLVSPSYTYDTLGTFIIRLTATPTKCPQLSRFVQKQIIVQKSPDNMKYPPVNAIAGKDLQLQAREFSGASYQWAPATGLSSSTRSNPIFNHTAEQQYIISIITSAGCRVYDTLLVRMFTEKKIYMPDYFTPNNDGKNDRIMPLLAGVPKLTKFRIWNRWGQLVYQTQKQGEGWDGIYQGVKQPMETYLWIAEGLDIDGKIITASGSFILVR